MTRQGFFPSLRTRLFGERTQRLQERGGANHALSYLLVIVQSAAVVLALGHQQIQLLFSPDPAIVAIAGMSLFLLVATVVAADLCLLATLRRIPALFRNRQGGALLEHLTYLAFVLLVEGSTFALVVATLDTDPTALVSNRAIIPPGGWLFAAQIAARAVLTVWTSVQLFIVRGKLPPQWSTLILEARELMGGQAQRIMQRLDLDAASLGQTFAAYAAMSRPPARIARWWNRGLVRQEQAALAEEDRQRETVVATLSAFEGVARSSGAGSEVVVAGSVSTPSGVGGVEVVEEEEKSPTAKKRTKREPTIRLEPRPRRTSQASAEQRIRRALASNPRLSGGELARLVGCSKSHAARVKKRIQDEQEALPIAS